MSDLAAPRRPRWPDQLPAHRERDPGGAFFKEAGDHDWRVRCDRGRVNVGAIAKHFGGGATRRRGCSTTGDLTACRTVGELMGQGHKGSDPREFTRSGSTPVDGSCLDKPRVPPRTRRDPRAPRARRLRIGQTHVDPMATASAARGRPRHAPAQFSPRDKDYDATSHSDGRRIL